MYLFELVFSFSSSIFPGVEFLDHKVVLFLLFWEISIPFSTVAVPIYVTTNRDQAWVFFGRNDAKAETPVLWPPHAKSWLIGKESDAGRDWGQEEKGTTEDEMAGWHHWLDGRESEWTPGVGDGRGAWYAVIHGVAKSQTRLSDWTEQYTRIPFSPHSHQHLWLADFMTIAILKGVRWRLIAVLVCISLMICDVEHLFMCLLAIYIPFLEKTYIQVFCPFFGCLLFLYRE